MPQPIETYNTQRARYAVEYDKRKRQHRSLAYARLAIMLLVLVAGFFGFRTQLPVYWIVAGTAFACFLVLLNLHLAASKKLQLAKTLLQLTDDEIAFLETGALAFPDGKAFETTNHPYSYDLDLFGPLSLFHHLNRAKTVMGTAQLAESLQRRASDDVIRGRQTAIQELAPQLAWRQEYMAKAQLAGDSEKIVQALRSWTTENEPVPTLLTLLSFALPLLGFSLTLWFAVDPKPLSGNLAVMVFIANLLVLASQLKKMNREIAHADKINATLLRYSELLYLIESNHWNDPLLQRIKSELSQNGSTASGHIRKLSRIFASLESLQNGFGAIVFNGTVLYHLHTYRQLLRWKKEHAEDISGWLQTIGELEVLISFANLAFNNPDFCYPQLNGESRLRFEELGHPLISRTKRVANSVDFTDKGFIILTGSNMSGKSTFLRTLGVNFVLANAGAPICAASANLQPMDILVSMRLTDSLADSESYFFAEVRRLKEIMEQLEEGRCFVLLDEILRGTNSDDKRSGTIEVVKKVIIRNALGAIATHDLEVCNTTTEFPDKLTNKCFEVEIVNDELYFDYRLREGVCKNKSATFLMKKMGVI